jgi:hypothetical protein
VPSRVEVDDEAAIGGGLVLVAGCPELEHGSGLWSAVLTHAKAA